MAEARNGPAARATLVRVGAIVAAVVGIVGMIITSIANSTGGALTFGLLAASAAGALVVANFVAHDGPEQMTEDALASRLESDIATGRRAGASEGVLRRLSRDSFELGRRSRN